MKVDINKSDRVSIVSLEAGDTFSVGNLNQPLIIIRPPDQFFSSGDKSGYISAAYLSTGQITSFSVDFKVIPVNLKVVRDDNEG